MDRHFSTPVTSTTETQHETAPGLEPERVLVVDDEAAALRVVQRMAEALGLRVNAVDGGLAAMACLKQWRYDLVLTDLQMPDVDGYSLASWIKHQWRHIPVIIMTGTCPAEVAAFRGKGIVDHWLFKPFGFKDLAVVFQRFVSIKLSA